MKTQENGSIQAGIEVGHYLRGLRSGAKKQYGLAYWRAISSGSPEPDKPHNLTSMGAQSVRMEIHAIQRKHQGEEPAKLITQWPWKYDPETGMVESEQPDLRGAYGHVCDLRQDSSGRFSDEDGRLIAAAPNLLWAAKKLMDEMHSRFDYLEPTAEEYAAMSNMLEAIKLAELI